jgi:hypothetical protein
MGSTTSWTTTNSNRPQAVAKPQNVRMLCELQRSTFSANSAKRIKAAPRLAPGGHVGYVPAAMKTPYREEATIKCPLCGLPHRIGAVRCVACRQPLDEQPNVGAMKDELARRKRDAMIAVLVIAGMLALNVWVFGGGGFILVFAPIGWLYWSLVRARVLRKAMARLAER